MTEEMEKVPIRRNGDVGPTAILTQSSRLKHGLDVQKRKLSWRHISIKWFTKQLNIERWRDEKLKYVCITNEAGYIIE